MKPSGANPNLVGMLIIIGSLLCLYLLPQLTRKTLFHFPLETEESTKEISKIALDSNMKVLFGSNVLRTFHLEGKRFTLREILNNVKRPILLNFWATWCPPCVEEFPSVEYLNRGLASSQQNVPLLITVTVDESERDVRKFYKTLGFEPTLIVLHDEDGVVSRALGTVKFPETYLLKSNMRISYKWVGPQKWLAHDVITQLSELTAP